MPRVIIVDDHVENLYMLRMLFTAHGWQVDEARHGAEALHLAQKDPPQLIVSDLLMPVMDGYTLLGHCKSDDRLKSIPFVVYTATYTDASDEKLAMDMGADAFIVKPTEPDVFMNRISQVVSASKEIEPAPPKKSADEESTQVKQYNEALIRKLEQKTLQLEQANWELERDIAQRKKLETEREKLHAQLIQAQKMESIGRLAGGIAHDFNNLVGVILGYADAALDIVDASSPVHADLVEIRKAAQRSAAITHQLLAFARMQPIERKLINLNATIDDMLNMLRQLVGKNIQLEWLPGEDVHAVLVDPAHITRILTNFCANARDAINGAGKIIITTQMTNFPEVHHARYGDLQPGRYVRLAVSDTGTGMDADTLSHLFEPFFTTKAVGKGTGLGLATIYGIVKQNDGFIDVSSEPGKGTTFEVFFLPQDGK
ncbi:MAG TPA: response regulator [Steroidobacteraceae bacterium]|nr:response regulator [Steroidobacteraceae bacterium]